MLKPEVRSGFRPNDPARALGLRPAIPHADEAQIRELARLKARLAKRDWLLGIRARLERELWHEVPRVRGMAPQTFFREHWCTLRPVILEGLVDHWPAMTRWSLDHFRSLGNPEVEVQSGRESDPEFESNSPAHKTRMRWHALLDRLAADPTTNDFYMTANNGTVNRTALAALWEEIGPIPGYLAKNRMGDGFFWMGPRGTITPWHHDLTQNFLLQIRGRKRVTLAAPEETPRMQNHLHCFSRFGTRTDFVDEPDAPHTLVCEIGPGDMLFLPVGWWHHVEALSMTIGMSFTNFVWPNDFEKTLAARDRL
ncbi:cupin-like domain-containing protein [Thermaurantiacus sp.]